jgi:protein involved in ribonucleotide reduction
MIDVIYFSNITENTHKFVQKLDLAKPALRIPIKGNFDYDIMNPYVLIVPTYGTGKSAREMIPHQVRKFLREESFRKPCSGVIAGGNINFGEEYGLAGNIIARKLGVPLLYKFELAGTSLDVERVQRGLEQYCSRPNKPVTASISIAA